MSIRLKLLLAIIFAVLLTTASILVTASFQMKEAFTANFEIGGKAQLQRMNAFVDLFFTSAIANTNLLGSAPVTLETVNSMTSYVERTESHKPIGANLPEGERLLFEELSRFIDNIPAYLLVYVGHSNGGFVQAPDDSLGAGFNPAKRPWFIDTVKAGQPIVTEAYLSDSGAMVCTVASPVNTGGNGQAVVGIDIELSTLSQEISSVTIGQTGYLMMLDHFGQIVADPKSGTEKGQREWLGKAIQPVEFDPSIEVIPEQAAKALQVLAQKKEGFAEVTFDGKDWLAGVQTTKHGWSLILLQSKDEIFSDSLTITFKILQVGIIIAAVMSIFAFLIAKSIASPVVTLTIAAQGVAEGNMDAIPKDSKAFSGELKVLHSSLQRMVGKLVELIKTAEGKIKEASEALATSNQCLQEAEESKAQAERARSEAIQETAERLASVVENLATTANALASEAHDSAKNVDLQRDRVSNTAAAINEMNSAVGEVASSIANTASLADKARQGAIEGKTLVLDVVASVKALETSSQELNHSLESLGTQVTDIGQIMGVINDIADQTNLLALNAAIEAARAGDAGRGFAVVADEVRKLAESTVQATKQVGKAITSIQKGTVENRQAMDAASEAVNKSTEIAVQAGEAIGNIERLVISTADNLRSIAAASEEQSATAEEINQSTQDVSNLADKVSQGTHNTADIAKKLVSISDSLSKVIADLRKGSASHK